jgi:hypothetical protein
MGRKQKKKKKKIKRICNNCKLFDPASSTCSIVVLHEGERHRLPVLAEDSCFFEGEFFDPSTKAMENFIDNVEEVKFWVENDEGEKINGDGTVKMEYPERFFGESLEEMYDLGEGLEHLEDIQNPSLDQSTEADSGSAS